MADFDAEAIVSDVIASMMWTMDATGYRIAIAHSEATVPIAVKAVTDAVRALHQPEERCGDSGGEWSVPRDQWDAAVDGKPETSFTVCAHCGSIEMRESQGDSEQACYLDAMWPCQTVRLLDQIDKAVQP